MAAETRSALARVAREHGDIDEWVAGKLGWDVETMGRYLSPEQVDAAALAMSSGQRGRGFILADQTGLGKGRILAALARAAALDGRRVVFLTRSEEHTSELQSLMRISYAVFCLKKKKEPHLTEQAKRTRLT